MTPEQQHIAYLAFFSLVAVELYGGIHATVSQQEPPTSPIEEKLSLATTIITLLGRGAGIAFLIWSFIHISWYAPIILILATFLGALFFRLLILPTLIPAPIALLVAVPVSYFMVGRLWIT